MKLIKRLLLWLALGVAALYGLAQLVDGEFARQFGMQILGVFGVIGLFFGIRASSLASREKKAAAAALTEQATSQTQRSAWSGELKKRAMDVSAVCSRNSRELEQVKLFDPDYRAQECLDRIGRDIMRASELQARLLAAAERLEQEDEQ